MSDESTASLRIKYESVGAEQLKRQAAEVKAASIEAAKTIVANSAIVKQATLADIKIETAGRVAALKNAAALQILEVKKANALELMERKNAAAQALAVEKTKQKEIAAAQKAASSGFFSSWAGYVTGINQAISLTQRFGGMLMDLANNAAVWDSYRIALETMEGGARNAEKAIADLYVIAKAPGIDQEGAQKAYLQFRALNIEGNKAKEMIKAFSNAVALGGGSSVEFNRVNIQLRQMLANNRVLESDLRFMKESMPMLAKVMQDTFGTSTAEGIRNLGISAGEFVEGILVGLEKLPKAQQNLKSEIENTANAWSILKASLIDTNAAKSFFNTWTTAFENLTAIIKAESVNWGKLLSIDVFKGFLWKGVPGALAAMKPQDGAIQTDREVERQKAIAAYDAIEEAKFQAKMAGRDFKTPSRLPEGYVPGRTKEETLSAIDAKYGYVGNWAGSTSGVTDLGNLPKPAPKPEKTKKVTNPLDVVGDKRYLTVDQLQGRNLLEAQAAIDKALMEEKDKANKEIEKQSEEWNANQKKKFNANQEAIFKNYKENEERLNKIDEERIKALQDLREAESGEYALRFAEIDAWEKEITQNMRATEEERTRIVEAANRKRTETYLEAYSKIAMDTSGFFGSMATMSQQFDAENTRRYAAFVAVQQGLAIASATLNIGVAMSRALQSGFTTVDGLIQMGVVAAEGGKILNSITAMNAAKVGKGAFATGGSLGYGEWGIAGEAGAEIIEGPARITSTRDTARALANASSAQGVVVNINDYAGVKADVKQNQDGSIDILLSKLEDSIASGVYSGSGKIGNAVERTYGLNRRGR